MRRPASVLVTGGAGFIGAVFVRRLLDAFPDVAVVTLDALTYAADPRRLDGVDPARHRLVHGDVRDGALVASLLADDRIDTVVHFAAETHVDRSIAGPDPFLATNVLGTAAVLEACRAVWGPDPGKRLHHVSTDEVYGDLRPGAPAARVGDAYRPSSPYAASKAAADHLVRAWARTWAVPASIHACANTYGPGQHREKLVPTVVLGLASGQGAPVYGDGRQIRDWLYVDDHADGVIAAITRGEAGRTWHLTADCPRENLGLVGQIAAILDRLRPAGAPHARGIRHVEDRPGHDRRYALDGASASELGWSPSVDLETGILRTVRAVLADDPTGRVAAGGAPADPV